MRYGAVELHPKHGSVYVTKRSSKLIRHYPGTDRSVSHDLGREATIIGCVLMVDDEDDRLALDQLLHTDRERNLIIGDDLYRRVVPNTQFNRKLYKHIGSGCWFVEVEFVALDPVPYNKDTGEALY
jgi:hypothetical protein